VVPEEIAALQVKGDDFRDPKPKQLAKATFPAGESGEGWVRVSMMVDPMGKPFEVAVIDSTGNKVFEKLALQAMENASFEPATLGGKPVVGYYETQYAFTSTRFSSRQPEFAKAFKALEAALKANDRAAADTAMGQLKIPTLYESAYYGIAKFRYASKWGDENEQAAALALAVGGAGYLPPEEQQIALLADFNLQLKRRDYIQVLQMWDRLRNAGPPDKATEAKLKPVIDEVVRMYKDAGTTYTMSGVIPDLGAWNVWLFKRSFSAAVSTGAISQVKLKCARRFVSLAFDPEAEYKVPDSFGACRLILEGSPGTQLTLTQSAPK